MAAHYWRARSLVWASTADFSTGTRLAWRKGLYRAHVSEDEMPPPLCALPLYPEDTDISGGDFVQALIRKA